MAICLGMQILFSASTEFGKTKGINYFKGNVTKFKQNKNIKIPHVMWNFIDFINSTDQNIYLVNSIDRKKMYFTHSFKVDNFDYDKNIYDISMTRYFDQRFISSLFAKNFICTQYHPELSGENGLKIYKYFLNII